MAMKVDNLLLFVIGNLVTLSSSTICWNDILHPFDCGTRSCCISGNRTEYCCDKLIVLDKSINNRLRDKLTPILIFSALGVTIFFCVCACGFREWRRNKTRHNYQRIPGQNVRNTSYQQQSERQYGRPPPQSERQCGRPPTQSERQYGRPPPQSERQCGRPPIQSERQYWRPPPQSERQSGRPPTQSERQYGRPPPQSERQNGRPQPQSESQYGSPPPISEPQYELPPPYRKHETTSFTDPPPPYQDCV